MEEKKSLSEKELYNIGSAMCARSEHCSSEVASKLFRGTDDEALVARVIARLCQEKFIDEERYARAFINDKIRFAKWGRLKIRQELWRKQIPESVYAPLLKDIDERQYISMLRDLLKAKRRTIKSKDPYELKAKLLRFGASRGFEPKYIYSALDLDEEAPEAYDSDIDF